MWASQRVQAFQLGDRYRLLRVPETGEEFILDIGAFQLLAHCRGFDTLRAHARAAAIALQAKPDFESKAMDLLQDLADRGLMRSATDTVRFLRGPEPPGPPPASPLSTVVIRTADRPDQLRRLLQSLIGHDRPGDTDHHYVIVDDSRDPAARALNHATLQELVSSEAGPGLYHGLDEQTALTRALIERFPASEAEIRWLLDPVDRAGETTPGRALNHALLITAGRRILLLDDDAVVSPYGPPAPDGPVRIGAVPQAWRFLPDAPMPPEQWQAPALDPFVEHGRWLGLSVAQLLRALPPEAGEPSVSTLDPQDLSWLGPRSRVRISVNSVYGDPGSAQAHWLYAPREPDVFSTLVAEESAYRRYTTQRHLWRGHRSMSLLTDHGLTLTAGVGLDNSTMLPPTLPEGRNEDLVLGDAIKCLYPDSLTLSLPWGLLHQPEPRRRWDPAALDIPIRPGPASVLSGFLDRVRGQCPAEDTMQRLLDVAQRARSMALSGVDTFRDQLIEQVLEKRTDIVGRLSDLMNNHPDAPEYWKADANRIVAANTRPLKARGEPWQSEIACGDHVDPDVVERTLRSLFENYGRALEIWPELWRYCHDRQR